MGGSTSFTVAPVTGFWEGTYRATVTVSGGGIAPKSFDLSFTVRETITYFLTVIDGSGDGDYAPGAAVTIIADPAPEGQEFDKWTGGNGGTIGDAGSPTATFTMPDGPATVTATYKAVPVLQLSGEPKDNTMRVGDTITLSLEGEAAPQTGSTGWTWDSEYFDATFDGAITFTAKQSGTSTITYTAADGQTVSIDIGILDAEDPVPLAGPEDPGDGAGEEALNPSAGSTASPWLWIGVAAAVVLVGLAALWFFVWRRRGRAQ